MRKTRIPVDDIFELVDRENRGLDKTQALFADMSERKHAWEELARHEDLELVGSLRYNIEVTRRESIKEQDLSISEAGLVLSGKRSWRSETEITIP